MWIGGQLLGVVFLLAMDALKAGPEASPPLNMKKSLIFESVVALAVMPLAFCVGWGKSKVNRRVAIDNGQDVDVPKRASMT